MQVSAQALIGAAHSASPAQRAALVAPARTAIDVTRGVTAMNTTFLPCTQLGTDPDTFFPVNPEQGVVAQALCATCPPPSTMDIVRVMADQRDLVEVQHRLSQVFNYKRV
ncbi:MAG: hypothetical protein ABJA34_05870 [Pseudonocardiales bacterium]